jgi:hypothetical protein
VHLASSVSIVVENTSESFRLLPAAALGALLYTLVNSIEYYLERRNKAMAGMFIGLWAAAVPAVIARTWYW